MAGVGGMLGEAFYSAFSPEYKTVATDIDVNSDWLEYLDFRDEKEYRRQVMAFQPDYLFHIGAHTSLEYCETNPDDAFLTNTISVEYATNIANELDIPIFYVSTAGIFDGSQSLYDDWDEPNPLGVYARSKYMGEQYVKTRARHYIIARAGWMMGGGPEKDKKFVNKLMAQIDSGATVLNIVDDKDGTPTYTVDFAENVKKLIDTGTRGLFNMVCGGQTSRSEVASELLQIIGRQDIKVNLVPSEFFDKEYFAPRPPNERLVNRRLDLLGLNTMRPWQDSLRTYLEEKF